MAEFSSRRSVPLSFGGLPRSVPLLVTIRLMFGGTLAQLGWLFFGLGMIFVWIFVASTDPYGTLLHLGSTETVSGTVVSSNETGFSENDRTVFANHFRFEHGGRTHKSTSYSTGGPRRPGQEIRVIVPAGRPRYARIDGMRTAPFGPLVGLVGIFPLVGLGLITGSLMRASRVYRLLRHGELAEGELVNKKATNAHINNQRVYKMTFKFTTRDGRRMQAVAKTHQTELLQDEGREPLLYDPADPRRATLLDHLPGGPRIDRQGEIWLQCTSWTVLTLIVPTLALVGHGIVFVLKYMS